MRRWLWLGAGLLALTSLATLGAGSQDADAVIPEVGGGGGGQASATDLVTRLSEPKTSQAALDGALRDPKAFATLTEIAEGDVDPVARGWAVVGLSRLDDPRVRKTLEGLMNDGGAPMLVRTWAASALVNRADSMKELQQLAQNQSTFPGLDRPLKLQVQAQLGGASLEELLALSSDGNLQQLVAPAIVDMAKADELVEVVYNAPDDAVRRQATAFLGAKHQQGATEVPGLVIDALRFDRRLDAVPWDGGALYVPGIQWDKNQGQKLITELMAWWLYLEAQGKRSGELNQVWNNLYSYSLLTTCGYDMGLSASADNVVAAYIKVEGKGAARELLARVRLSDDPRFEGLL